MRERKKFLRIHESQTAANNKNEEMRARHTQENKAENEIDEEKKEVDEKQYNKLSYRSETT